MKSGLSALGFERPGNVLANLAAERLCEEIVRRGEASFSEDGSVVAQTGKYTGRSPGDKFVIREPSTEKDIWWGDVNQPFESAHFDALFERVIAYLEGRDVFVQDLYAGADPQFQLSVRVVNEFAWHSLFARNMFICPDAQTLEKGTFEPDWHLVYAPGFVAQPDRDHTRSEAFVLLNFARKLILIGGTCYAGELKKSVFTLLNYLLPKQGVLSMHCSANTNATGETTLFFGLSGTGKTTLSANAECSLIGDDEHGWTDRGVFNFEGGCYAKAIHLSAEAEPEIYAASRRFGSILENVVCDDAGHVDFDDGSLTENTRVSYPLSFIPNASDDGLGDHPAQIIMLTCDAFGVLPPVSRLSADQAMYHFISGYTAKVAGTERGVSEPTATFSPCFGAPFLVLPPAFYARMLGEKIHQHGSRCWLVNTGWSGGGYRVGKRISIAHTRAIVTAIQEGLLDDAPCDVDPWFGLQVPRQCPGVPDEILNPKATWKDAAAYDESAADLARRFNEHFTAYEELAPELKAVAPTVVPTT
jgi:phosphoenolpyruvate carboxykinase (ATP)